MYRNMSDFCEKHHVMLFFQCFVEFQAEGAKEGVTPVWRSKGGVMRSDSAQLGDTRSDSAQLGDRRSAIILFIFALKTL